jgi:hypothetical protein
VLNQGRLVFEGALADTRQREKWVRIKVGDFAEAVRGMREARLIAAERDGALISLAEGVGSDEVVRFLVQRGVSVYEIAPAEETLEGFYLSLMNETREAPAK